MNSNEPLAYRVRPKTLEEYVGQKHILGKDKILYRTIKADRLSSLILFGPPGCGKTSLAKVISETTKYRFYKINAVTAGVADIKAVIEETKNFMLNPTGKAILFIDEIHRFNKLQQDALLPFVENGTIILIGATTENPYFEVNKALISRSMVVKLEPLDEEDIFEVLKMALKKPEGLGEYNINIEDINRGSTDNKGLVLKITDKRLLEKTGGIIQGMSGAPIIQNGKIIGAVTHVFVNDPTKGYGIFIEEMIE